ncbi:a4df025e-5738-40a3-8726-fc1fe57100c5 [Sclerotinia trifoliorum]|uniref:A4df025e-5738-40a3-8726-fc1fe57100c5 n=1 Tax=Sclerotinia trifoliorum TaxID=28548 RepID=A0A8H2VMG2_9HELO|nr:a4df025e-5738-40a3-8726-fc1fe57100c5 [Sclerotinia trifoliorum]
MLGPAGPVTSVGDVDGEFEGEGKLDGGENRESRSVSIMTSKRNFAEEEEEKNPGTGKRLKTQEDKKEDEKAEIKQQKEETADEKDDNYTNLTQTTLLAAVEIGTNIQDMREIIEQTISSIWVYEKRRIGRGDKTCRQFLMHCISEMESLGILSLLPGKSGFDLEREAKEFGMLSDPALNPAARRGRLWKSRIIS